MAIKNSLLKEAIADAKAIQSVAVENAKQILQEAFTPKIQSMLGQRIQNEAEGDEENIEEPTEEPVDGDEVPISDEPMGDEPTEEPTEEEPTEEPIEEPTEEEPVEEPTEEPIEEPVDEGDLELEALIRELETEGDQLSEELANTSGIATGDNKKPSTSASNSSKVGSKKEKTIGDKSKESKNFLGEGEGCETENPEEEIEETINIDEIIADLEGEENGSEEGEDDIENTEDENPEYGSQDESVDIDKIIAELESPLETATQSSHITGNDVINENRQLKRENRKLKDDLKEHSEAVTYMKGKINEVNLLNAKLLYTNKLFKSHMLTNEQKMMVIESFDRAINTRETKMTYVTLMETLNKTAKTKVAKIQESVSKPVVSTKSNKAVILNESQVIAQRFKELANLDKSKMKNYRQ